MLSIFNSVDWHLFSRPPDQLFKKIFISLHRTLDMHATMQFNYRNISWPVMMQISMSVKQTMEAAVLQPTAPTL